MKSILGFHDKNKGTYTMIDKKLPILVDERYEPFLMSTRQFFRLPSNLVERELYAIPIRNVIKKFKTTISTILIIPGTITAVIYLVDFAGALVQSKTFLLTLPTWLTNITFWGAVWGAMILWHENYRFIRKKAKVLEGSIFSEHDIKAIKNGNLGLSKLSLCSPLDVISQEGKTFLFKSIKKNKLDTFILLKRLLTEENCQTILRKLDLVNFPEEFDSYNINEKSIPKYHISALRSLLLYSAEEALIAGSSTINPEHIFVSLFRIFPALNSYLKKQKQNVELMRYVTKWLHIKQTQTRMTRTFDPDITYFRTGGIAKSWVYGYTFVLSHYSKDLNEKMARDGGHYGIGHDREMEEIISILSKVTKNNVLLTGESGTGKTSIAKGLAERINKGTIPGAMKDMRIIQLDLNGLIAAAPQYGNLESLIQQTMNELQKAGNTVLFIDEIQEIVPAKGEESQHSLAGILLPYILESNFPIIGTITYADYKKFFYSRESLRQSFQNVEIKEVSPQAAFEILLTRLEELERTYHIDITFPAILGAIELAQRYVYDRKLPDSAVNIIESACASLENTVEKKLTMAHIARAISTQTEIPVAEVSTDEATRLLDLEKNIKSKVIGQDEAVHQVVEALKRARTDIRDPDKPIGTFLFLGPTGVGKTYLAKTVNNEYFGEKRDLIRLDLSEFKDTASIKRLLGSNEISETSQSPVTFLDEVKRNPFSTVLLDEIEKAHPQILDIFLQMLDEGRLTSSTGETISFSNCIIIATSNIGSKTLLEALERDRTLFNEAKSHVLIELRQQVRVEFLNRFDKIIVFSPHDMENLTKIATLLLKELKARLSEKEITLEWEDNIPGITARQAQEPGLGARPLRRYIQEKVEGIIATKLLQKELKPGDSFILNSSMLQTT